MENSKYLEATVTGIKAYVEGYVILRQSLVYVSVFGGNDSVKSFNAGFLSRMEMSFRDGNYYNRSHGNYRMWTQKLTNSVAHGVVFVEELFDLSKSKSEAVIIGKTMMELLDKTYALLQSRTTVPLLDSWKKQIVIDMVTREPLKSFGVGLAYLVRLPNDKELEEYVKSNLESLRRNIL